MSNFDSFFKGFESLFSDFDELMASTFNEPRYDYGFSNRKRSLVFDKKEEKAIDKTANTKPNSRVYGVKFDIDNYQWDSTVVELNGNTLSVEAHKRNGDNIKEKSLCTTIPSDIDTSTMKKKWDTDNHKLIVTFLRKKNK